jgi:HlyD family secretion protein
VNAQIEDVELRLRRTQVTAPVAGKITARNARVGAVASATGQPLFVIVSEGLLEQVADIAEQDVLRLQEGQAATLHLVGLTQMLTGHVRRIEPTVDSATRLGHARIALDDPSQVREGLFAEAEILVAERTALAVPVSSIGMTDGKSSVLRVDAEGRVERVEVETGIRDGGFVEISSGLSEGDQIVARAGAFVRPGDLVNPVPVE